MKNLSIVFIVLKISILFSFAQTESRFSIEGRSGAGILLGDIHELKSNLISSVGVDYKVSKRLNIGLDYTYGNFSGDEGEKSFSRSFQSQQNIITLKSSFCLKNLVRKIHHSPRINLRVGTVLGIVNSNLTVSNNSDGSLARSKNTAVLTGLNFEFSYILSQNISFILEEDILISNNDGIDGYVSNNVNDSFFLFSAGLKINLNKKGKRYRPKYIPTNNSQVSDYKFAVLSKQLPKKKNTELVNANLEEKSQRIGINKPAEKKINEWEYKGVNNGIEVYYRWLETNDYMMIKLKNINNTEMKVSFKPIVAMGNGINTKTMPSKYVYIGKKTSMTVHIDLRCNDKNEVALHLGNLYVTKR